MRHRCYVAIVTVTLLTTVAAPTPRSSTRHTRTPSRSWARRSLPTDAERVTWLGDGRIGVDAGTTTYIVRLDSSTLFLIDHEARTVSSVELPVNVARLLPEGMAEQMQAMMHVDFEVASTDETKQVGE